MRIKREIWVLICILIVGAILRGAYLAEIVHHPDFTAPGVDAGYHDYWARAIVSGKWSPPPPYHDPLIRTTSYFRPPGYPYFLALVYRITGSSYLGARMIQMALGLLCGLLAFFFGRRWFGSRMGLIFAGMMSVYWGFIYFEGDLVEPVLVSALALLLIWDLSRWTEKVTFPRAMLTGLLLGLSALVRPNVLLFGPAILLWAWWVLRDRRRFVTASLGLILAAGLTISPATIRNYVVAHDFVPISSNSGVNLILGNNQTADGTVSTMIPGIGEFNTCFDYPRIASAVVEKVGRPLKDSQVSAYLGAQAKEYMRAHPLATVKLTWRKALLFWGPREVSNNKEDELERADSPVLHRIPGNFALATALFILGLLALTTGRKKEADKQFQASMLVILFIAAYFVSYLPYFAAGRFRMPMVPFLLFFGALGVDRIVQFAIERNMKAVGIWVLVLIAAYGLTSRNFAGYQPDVGKWHFDRGLSLAGAGRTDEAIREYRASLETKPDFPPALYNLGAMLIAKGKYDEAMGYFEAALKIAPDDYWSHYGMGLAYSGLHQTDNAIRAYREAIRLNPDFYSAHKEMGMALLAAKQMDQALAELSEAVRLNADLGSAHAAMASILASEGKLDEAAEHFQAALSTEPTPITYFEYAGVLLRQKKLDESAQAYEDAIRLKPDYVKAHNNLAVVLFFKGDYAEAWKEVDLCRKYGGNPNPGFLQALADKQKRP